MHRVFLLTLALTVLTTTAALGTPGEIAVRPDAVPSGILYDRVVPLADLGSLQETTSVSAARWRQMVDELDRAGMRPGRSAVQSIRESVGRTAPSGIIPIGMLHARYEQIRDEAQARRKLEQGLALAAEDLGSHEVFAVAALRSHTYRGERVTFLLDEAWFAGNADQPARLQIDLGEGSGFLDVTWDQPIAASYRSTGTKTIRVRATFPDGSTRIATTSLDVLALAAPTPDDTLQVTGQVPYLGGVASGDAYVMLAPGHTDITDPVIVVEGFDLDNSLGWDELHALLNTEGLLDSLLSLGMDAVVLNFDEATDYIQRNGELTVSLIQEVLSRIEPNVSVAMVGASMGGLVTRYALARMEDQAINHRVRTFISFDSPQSGANIPLGIQYWLDFFSDQSTEAEFLLSRLDTPAARQMLVYHHTTPPSSSPGSDPLRGQLDAEFATLGDYPALPRLVAVANGSRAGMNQGFGAGQQIIFYEYRSFLVDVTGNVWAVPNGPSTQILQAETDIILLPADVLNVSVSGTQPYDSAPGGYRGSMADMDAVVAPYGDIVALFPNHCFIPTVSALDLNTIDLFHDIDGDPNLLALSPFDALYVPEQNQEHVAITPENAAWFITELVQTQAAVGPEAIANPLRFSVSPNPMVGAARLAFTLNESAPVRIDVLDVAGRRVATLLQANLLAGHHDVLWDGRTDRREPVGAGVYFIRLATDRSEITQRVVRTH